MRTNAQTAAPGRDDATSATTPSRAPWSRPSARVGAATAGPDDGGPPGPRRTQLHAWAEVRGLVGGHAAAGRDVGLRTTDDVGLRATLLPGPRGVGAGPAVVLLHGFAGHRRKPRYAWLADELATRFTVLAPDLRGHGTSGGTSTLGTDEHRDLAACLAHLRGLGHGWVATVGVSMGATSTANAAVHGTTGDAAVLVSGPARIELEPTSAPMVRLRRVWDARLGRAALRGVVGVRVPHPDAWVPPTDPVEAAPALPSPTLVVHGEDDEWFGVDGAAEVAAAHGRATLWREPVFGHAEDGFHGSFGRRLALALQDAHRTGRFPTRQESLWHA